MTQRVEVTLDEALEAVENMRGSDELSRKFMEKPELAAMEEPPPPVRMRLAQPKDLHYMLKSWLETCRYTSWGGDCLNNVYYPNQQKLIGKIAARPGCLATCAVDPVDDDQIIGYIIAEPAHISPTGERMPLVVHYIHVKGPLRKLGVGRSLLRQMGWKRGDPIVASHLSKTLKQGERFLMKKFRVIHNPYVLMLHDWFKGWAD